MLAWLQKKFLIRRLRKRVASWSAERDAEIRAAVKQKKSREDIEDIGRNWEYDICSTEDEIEEMRSSHLIALATKYDVPIPSSSDLAEYWERSNYTGKHYLNGIGRARLRAELNREQREWRDRWVWLIPVVFGLLGSATGIISLLTRK